MCSMAISFLLRRKKMLEGRMGAGILSMYSACSSFTPSSIAAIPLVAVTYHLVFQVDREVSGFSLIVPPSDPGTGAQ